MNKHDTLPRARSAELVVQELPDETLIYDPASHKAHCLNLTASLVWKHCDGLTTFDQLDDVLLRETACRPNSDIALLALRQLESAGLLEHDAATSIRASYPARRDVLKRLGLIGAAAVALPTVISVVAPTPVQAATCLPSGSPCSLSQSARCCSGLCAAQPFPASPLCS